MNVTTTGEGSKSRVFFIMPFDFVSYGIFVVQVHLAERSSRSGRRYRLLPQDLILYGKSKNVANSRLFSIGCSFHSNFGHNLPSRTRANRYCPN